MAGIEPLPASESLESPKAENEIVWKKTTDQTGAAYSGKNTFKSGEGEFTVVHQGDSFAKAHSYLLLTDVPGASANSGATITAKDSNGKQAFVATETRGTTEQEAAVGAGSELKTLLDQAGKSEFLQLASLAKRKVNFGTAKLKFEASKFPGLKEITHGLGVTPLAVIATSENNVVTLSTQGYTSTKFDLWGGNWFEPLNGELPVPVHWVAIG